MPEQPEVQGLLALMLLTDGRRLARTGSHGEIDRWTGRIDRDGIVRRSTRRRLCSARRCRAGPRVPIRCRPPSRSPWSMGRELGLRRSRRCRQTRVADRYRLQAARAHLLERAGQIEEAVAWYHRAAQGTASTAERDYLLLRAGGLRA